MASIPVKGLAAGHPENPSSPENPRIQVRQDWSEPSKKQAKNQELRFFPKQCGANQINHGPAQHAVDKEPSLTDDVCFWCYGFCRGQTSEKANEDPVAGVGYIDV